MTFQRFPKVSIGSCPRSGYVVVGQDDIRSFYLQVFEVRLMPSDVIEIILGSMMFVAGIGKLLPGEGFRYTLIQYAKVLGWPTTSPAWDFLAATLPWLQIFIGALLMRGVLVREDAALVGLMLFAFAGVQLATLLRRQVLECGCFGKLQRDPVRPFTIARDVVLALISIALATQSSLH